MLGGLLMLLDVHLAVSVLIDQRHVISADEPDLVEVEQGVVVGQGVCLVGVGRGIDEHALLLI